MTHEQMRAAAIRVAVSTGFSEAEMTAAGVPTVDALNKRVEAEYRPVTAKERDEAWAWRQTSEPAQDEPAEPEPEPEAEPEAEPAAIEFESATEWPEQGAVRILIEKAPMNPVPLYVHGIGRFSLTVGEEHDIPTEALDALRNSDVQFTEIEG
jgi:hypothetical protein